MIDGMINNPTVFGGILNHAYIASQPNNDSFLI